MIKEPVSIEKVIDFVRAASRIIMRHYGEKKTLGIAHKHDASPVTEADLAANRYIVARLAELTPDIPIVSEEGAQKESHRKAVRFWLVDPLDGTKSFIRKTGQFTVNIGLIENGTPVLGVVSMPVRDELYYTGADGRAYCSVGKENPRPVRCRPMPAKGVRVVASHSHRTPETDAFIATLPGVEKLVAAASSLKFCLLAAGEADIYPRFGPTMEWDTAAGHAILLAAGGHMETPEGQPFRYGKPGYRNGNFVAYGKR